MNGVCIYVCVSSDEWMLNVQVRKSKSSSNKMRCWFKERIKEERKERKK
jgi:hypothetical protein